MTSAVNIYYIQSDVKELQFQFFNVVTISVYIMVGEVSRNNFKKIKKIFSYYQ